MKTDPRIDAYIDRAAPFAQPILTYLRALVHEALPDADEGIKWGMPHWMIGGKNVAGMSAFKAHCAFVIHGEGRQGAAVGEGMGGYGKIAALDDLPPRDALIAAVRATAARLGAMAAPRVKRAAKPDIPVPPEFAAALAGNAAAHATFDGFAPSHRREYLEWITQAKRAETRTSRIDQAIAWLAEGKKRNWKYEGC